MVEPVSSNFNLLVFFSISPWEELGNIEFVADSVDLFKSFFGYTYFLLLVL